MSEQEVEGRRVQPYPDDEISLVDIVVTFIRHRKIFYLVFGVVSLAGLAYALLAPEKYEYSSLVQLAEVEAGEYVQDPPTAIANLESRWVPELKTLYREAEGKRLPFDITFENPENTGLVRMLSEAGPADAEQVKSSHQQLIEQLLSSQSAQLSSHRRSLERRIKAVNDAIEQLQGGEDTGSAIAAAYEKRVELEGDLEALQEGEALVVARESAERKGTSKGLIVALAVMLGAMLGVFMAFIAEFGASVKRSLESVDPT